MEFKSLINAYKYKLATVGATVSGAAVTAISAANAQAVDFSNVTAIVNSAVDVIPAITNLVVNIVPLMITLGIVGLVLGIFGAIVMFVKDGLKF